VIRLSSADTEPGTDVEVVEEPTDELREGLVAQLRERLGDALVESHIAPGQDLTVRVATEAWTDVADVLRNAMGARYFCFLSAIDWKPSPYGRYLDAEVDKVLAAAEDPTAEAPEPQPMETGVCGGEARFQVLARLANVRHHWGITLKADTSSDDSPSIETWTRIFAGADWHEREAWEMFGITFVGHPHLRHIYLPTDFEGSPLRKDFPLVSRIVKPWPGIVDVEPMPTTEEENTGTDSSGSAEGGDNPAGSSETTDSSPEDATS
jgi:NADH-quinone oxidoreductase subunit C